MQVGNLDLTKAWGPRSLGIPYPPAHARTHLGDCQQLAINRNAEHLHVVVKGVGGAGQERSVLHRDGPRHVCVAQQQHAIALHHPKAQREHVINHAGLDKLVHNCGAQWAVGRVMGKQQVHINAHWSLHDLAQASDSPPSSTAAPEASLFPRPSRPSARC